MRDKYSKVGVKTNNYHILNTWDKLTELLRRKLEEQASILKDQMEKIVEKSNNYEGSIYYRPNAIVQIFIIHVQGDTNKYITG